MNWIQQNKFLTGYLAILLAGLGVLGYFLYTSGSNASAVSDQYAHQVAEMHRLETLPAYPNQENLDKLKEQGAQFVQQVDGLRDKVAAMQFPLDATITPEQFQERLHQVVLDLRQKAQQNGVALGDDFYLGFKNYRDSLPSQSQAPALARQLQAVQFVVSDLIENKVVELTDIKRGSLPEEGAAENASARGRGRGSGFSSSRIEITFTADQPNFRKILNDISSTTKQFYVVRSLTVANEKETGPDRASAQSTSSANSQPAPTANGQPTPAEAIKPVLGAEKLTVTMLIEIFNFASATQK